MLDIGMPELVISDDVNDIRPEQISVTDSIRHSHLSDTRYDPDLLNAESKVGLAPWH